MPNENGEISEGSSEDLRSLFEDVRLIIEELNMNYSKEVLRNLKEMEKIEEIDLRQYEIELEQTLKAENVNQAFMRLLIRQSIKENILEGSNIANFKKVQSRIQ